MGSVHSTIILSQVICSQNICFLTYQIKLPKNSKLTYQLLGTKKIIIEYALTLQGSSQRQGIYLLSQRMGGRERWMERWKEGERGRLGEMKGGRVGRRMEHIQHHTRQTQSKVWWTIPGRAATTGEVTAPCHKCLPAHQAFCCWHTEHLQQLFWRTGSWPSSKGSEALLIHLLRAVRAGDWETRDTALRASSREAGP